MIIVGSNDEVLSCSCGTKFIATPLDFRLWSTGTELIKFTECPKCRTTHHIILSASDGSEIIDIIADNGNEKEKEDEIVNKTT